MLTGSSPDDHSQGNPLLERAAVLLAVALMLLGAVIRLRAYLVQSPLYIDEALLVQNILTRSIARLWQPLDLAQSAPPLFLVAVQAIGRAFGYGERALRVLPLLAGCILLPVAWMASRQMLAKEESAIVVALLALSPIAIFYANMFKPYSSDMLVTAVIIGVSIPAIRLPSNRRLLLVALTGVLCILVSSTALFVLGGAGASLGIRALRDRATRTIVAVAAMGAVWCGLIVALLRTTYAQLSDPGSAAALYMHDFWKSTFFLHSKRGLVDSLRRSMASLLSASFFDNPGGDHFGVVTIILLVLFVIGLVVLLRRERDLFVLLAVPLVMLLLASLANRYPLGTRLVLFMAPITAIGIAIGMGAVLRRFPPVARIGLLACALAVPGLHGLSLLKHPQDPAPRTPYDEWISRGAQLSVPDASAIFVRSEDVPTLLYYGFDKSRPDSAVARRLLNLIDLRGPVPLFTPMRDLIGLPRDVPDSALLVPVKARRVLVMRQSWFFASRGRTRPDSAWGPREAASIRAAGPCTDIYLGPVTSEDEALSTAIESLGGVITNRRQVRANSRFRACFPARSPAPG